MSAAARHRTRDQRGSAIADFVLVAIVLVPILFGVLQLALIWHVKSTLTAAASEGAHFAASYQRTDGQGAQRTRALIDEAFGADFDDTVTAHDSRVDGQPGVEVVVHAKVPVLAFWGPTVAVEVHGHAIREVLP